MAVRDHTGRIRSSIPLDGTLTSGFDGSRPAGSVACGGSCRRKPTAAIGDA